MTPEDLAHVMADVRRLRARFADTAPRVWEPVTAAVELAVQLGHLALCLLQRIGGDTSELTDQARPITSVGDELADVLLAALSVTALAGNQPSPIPARPPGWQCTELTEFLRLVAAAGQLSEAAMIAGGYRHQPQGGPPSIPAASSIVVACCERLATEADLNLRAEFRCMVADADAFLDSRVGRR